MSDRIEASKKRAITIRENSKRVRLNPVEPPAALIARKYHTVEGCFSHYFCIDRKWYVFFREKDLYVTRGGYLVYDKLENTLDGKPQIIMVHRVIMREQLEEAGEMRRVGFRNHRKTDLREENLYLLPVKK